jgi:hypothetical protein
MVNRNLEGSPDVATYPLHMSAMVLEEVKLNRQA